VSIYRRQTNGRSVSPVVFLGNFRSIFERCVTVRSRWVLSCLALIIYMLYHAHYRLYVSGIDESVAVEIQKPT
jgi:hypothetical protein